MIHSDLWRLHAFVLMVLALCLPGKRGIGDELATAPQRYLGMMALPMDLITQEGTKIEKGKCEIEVYVLEGARWILSFLPESKRRVIVKGKLEAGDPFDLSAMTPLVGTHYMRSSAEPLKTAQERQFSKTGLPQYAEQERDWKATLRVYQSYSEPGEVMFVFQVRNAGGALKRADFKLRSLPRDEKRQ